MSSATTMDLAQLDPRLQPCPICNGMEFRALAFHDRNLLGIRTVGCTNCGLVQSNPRPSAHGLNVFYRDHYRLFYQKTSSPDQAYIANLNKDVRLAYTASYFTKELCQSRDAVILDFGCGEGSLFAALRKAGFVGRFYGVELNANFGEFASRYGGATVANTVRAAEPVDLAILNHVLEHLDDPIGTLRQLAGLLKPDGRLYIDVPDADAYKSIFDLHIAHIYHFTMQTLPRLVERSGLMVTHVERHCPPHHPPSIRLVARNPQSGEIVTPRTTRAEEETAAWAAISRSGRFLGTLRLRLARVPLARLAYRLVRGQLGRN
jgi:SAM-dependent methyltransferase